MTAHRARALALIAALAAAPCGASAAPTPLAAGHERFLGSAYGSAQAQDFARYWNKITPENAGKWGEVEAERDVMRWEALDDAYRYAKAHRLPFQFHVLVWGNQQPAWIRHLPRREQRAEIEEWFAAVAARYPDLDYVEVVNEPLHDPPSRDDPDGGNYLEALGGSGRSGWDWVLESFRLARAHFPRAKLLINEYSLTNTPESTRRYREIVELLQKEKLVDGIGVQGHAFSTTFEAPLATHRANLDSLAQTGLPIYVTELDVDGRDDIQQLAAYQRVFPMFWEHPAVAGVTLWGFRPGLWRDAQGAALLRADGSERPALAWLRAYLRGTTIDCTQPAQVCDAPSPGSLALIDAGRPATILVDDRDFPGVLRAARSLRGDLSALAGREAEFSTSTATPGVTAILAGTLGRSARIDRLVRDGKLDANGVAGRREAYSIQVVDAPEAGVARALVIAGADKRGTIFGLYELARRLGVSPWTFWADVPIASRAHAHIAPGRFVDAPKVRYRGIFLNDEDPALGGWARATYGGPNHRFYERVFELILRLKGNYLWPAMWGRAFYDDDPENAKLADEMGVVIATSHHEPMMRAHVEWQRYGKGSWDYTRNAQLLRRFWRDGIERMGAREGVVTLGMRGDGDEPMSDGTAVELLQTIVADQRRILTDVTGRPPEATPQVWTLYKEVQDYFDQGMQVPDDVTLLFTDDNWGNVRRLPKPGTTRPGGYGVYYHFDYVGGPRNYKWLNTVQIERTWEQMQRAWAHGVNRLWIVNVGDLKPMELPISFFLDFAWDPDSMTDARRQTYARDWAAEQFGPAHAADIGELLTRYTQYNARRKPELLEPSTYSLANHDEAPRVARDWDALAARSATIGAALGPRHRDAWYQLVEFPILASGNLHALYVAAARNRLYATQARVATNAQADEVRRRFARDAELARVYEHDIANGKWRHMMSQTHIGYTGWQQPERDVMPEVRTLVLPEAAAMGVAVEGDARAWPGTDAPPAVPPLDRDGARTRRIEVFNRGRAAFRVVATSPEPWLRIVPADAEVTDQVALSLEVDFDRAPKGDRIVPVSLRGSEGTQLQVAVPVLHAEGTPVGFVESDRTIAIEAEHFATSAAPAGQSWKVVPELGRTLSGVLSWPPTAPASTPGGDGARLEYPIWLREPGELEVRVVLSPSLDVAARGGLRFAVSIDDAAPLLVTMRLDPTPGHADFRAWERAVSDSVHVATSRHRVGRAGAHTLTLWRVDPGVAFQRIELVRGDARSSYLGPPESVRR
jgi:GH35 family endo-1,4-beta-xylanase